MPKFTHRSLVGCRKKQTLPATQFLVAKTTNKIKWKYKVNTLYFYIKAIDI